MLTKMEKFVRINVTCQSYIEQCRQDLTRKLQKKLSLAFPLSMEEAIYSLEINLNPLNVYHN